MTSSPGPLKPPIRESILIVPGGAALVMAVLVALSFDLQLLASALGALNAPLGSVLPSAVVSLADVLVVFITLTIPLVVGVDAYHRRRGWLLWGTSALVIPGLGALAWLIARTRADSGTPTSQ
jgi:hypothetical protein